MIWHCQEYNSAKDTTWDRPEIEERVGKLEVAKRLYAFLALTISGLSGESVRARLNGSQFSWAVVINAVISQDSLGDQITNRE